MPASCPLRTRLRWVFLIAGVALVALAFGAATHVADTREGLIAEVITLFAGLVGISLVLYGLLANARPGRPVREGPLPKTATTPAPVTVVASANQLVSGGVQWAGLGLILLLPMVAGSAYLCVRFFRAPERDWRLDLKRPKSRKES